MAGNEAGKMVDQSSGNVETDISATETDLSVPSQVSEYAAPMGISTQTSSNSTGDTDEPKCRNFTHSRSGSTGKASALHMSLSQPTSSPSQESYMQNLPNITSPQQAIYDEPSANIALVGQMSSKVSESERIIFEGSATPTQMDEVPVFQEATDTGESSEMLLPQSNFPAVKSENDTFVIGTEFMNSTHADQREKAKKICDAVSQYYMERFLYRWKNKTKHESSTITVIAALLVERNNRFSVVVLTAGTKIKFECSYFMRKSDPDEPTWGLCDGHAEAVCYRLASVYLLTELYKLHETRDSIFEKSNDGYMLKKGIKFHLFTSHPPCGFMAKKERHFLSWKRPFVGTPHILQCSSKILISSYLGIQGALTHLLVKPIYISSVTMPRYKTVETLHDSYIKDRFEKFYTQLSALSTPEDQYVFYPPHIEIVDVDPCSLFKECYKPYILLGDTQAGKTNQIPEEVASNRKRYKNKALKVAGTIPDVNQNIGIRTLVFNIDNGIGSQEFRESVLSLQHKLVKLQHDLKEKRFKSLQQARAKLSQALNIKEALGELREILLKQVKASCEFRQQKAEEIVELLTKSTMQSTVTDELTVLYEELKPSLGKVSKNNELGQIVNSVGENVTYQKMLDDLEILSEQGKHHSWDSEFYLDLMGCDWARYMRSISNDVSRSVFD